jgi:hypothetical protein
MPIWEYVKTFLSARKPSHARNFESFTPGSHIRVLPVQVIFDEQRDERLDNMSQI